MNSPVVRVDQFNAFCVNRLGLNGPGFPLSINVEASDGIWVTTGTAARAFDLVDVLVASAQDLAVVLNIGHNWLGDDGHPHPEHGRQFAGPVAGIAGRVRTGRQRHCCHGCRA